MKRHILLLSLIKYNNIKNILLVVILKLAYAGAGLIILTLIVCAQWMSKN